MGRPRRSAGGDGHERHEPRAQRRIPMTVTFLEMTAKPAVAAAAAAAGKIALLRGEKPPRAFLPLSLRHDRRRLLLGGPQEARRRAAGGDHPGPAATELYVLYTDGSPAGMAELDLRNDGTANIAYFGLMPEDVGRRLGYFFLYHTCMNAWAQPIAAAGQHLHPGPSPRPAALPAHGLRPLCAARSASSSCL